MPTQKPLQKIYGSCNFNFLKKLHPKSDPQTWNGSKTRKLLDS